MTEEEMRDKIIDKYVARLLAEEEELAVLNDEPPAVNDPNSALARALGIDEMDDIAEEAEDD